MNQIDQLSTKLTNKYDSALFLGRLCWYSIPDTVNISRDDFVDILDASGVPFGGNIPEIRPVDVFKRGCTSGEVNKYLPSDNERLTLGLPTGHVNYLFRNAGQDKDKVWRSLVREVVDSSGHRIGHSEIASLTYDRLDKSIITTVLVSSGLFPIERNVVNSVIDYFKSEAERITPYSIREFVRKGLEWNLHAIKVRPSGGIYFTQEQFSTVVTALEKAINDIGGSFHTLPLLDDSKQREMLKKAFEDESLDDINDLMAEVNEIQKSGKLISSDKFADFDVRYKKLLKKVKEYSDVLDEALETTGSYLDIADLQLRSLLANNVKTDAVL